MLIDCHAHVYRAPPGHHVPFPVERYLDTMRANGVGAAVLVQPSFFGTDHGELLSALAVAPGKLRAVGAATDAFTTDDMEPLHAAGVRGIRVNFFRGAKADLSTAAWRRVAAMLEEKGWHLELNARTEDMPGVLRQVVGLGIPITIDHLGRPDDTGPGSEGFRAMLSLAARQTIYVKLTGTFRFTPGVAKDCLQAWLDVVGPHRALWGSDCPWVEMKSPPTYDQTLEWLRECVASDGDMAAILGGNSRTLYGFSSSVGA